MAENNSDQQDDKVRLNFRESDWKEAETSTGRKFYVNYKTGQTSWAIGPLPVGFSCREDSQGRIYFINNKNGKRTFEDPRLKKKVHNEAQKVGDAKVKNLNTKNKVDEEAQTASDAGIQASNPTTEEYNYDKEIESVLENNTNAEKSSNETIPLNQIAIQQWLNITSKKSRIDFVPGLYHSYLNGGLPLNDIEQISRDVGRTYAKRAFFAPEAGGQQKLKNVMGAWCLHDPFVGYVQGMNLVVGYLLQRTNTAEETFWLFLRLMEDVNL